MPEATTAPAQVTVRPEHVINVHGGTHPSYEGVLDAATQAGLLGIEVEILQMPTDANGREAICRAIVTMANGRKFADIGDAAPGNVSNNIKPHIIRMASTRAKGRALRDAINVGQALAEETDGTHSAPPVANANKGARPTGNGNGSKAGAPAASPNPVCVTPACGRAITDGQLEYALKTYGKPLCPACQKAAKNAGNAPAAPAPAAAPAAPAAPKPIPPERWEEAITALNSPDEALRAKVAGWINNRINELGATVVDDHLACAEARLAAKTATPAPDDPFGG